MKKAMTREQYLDAVNTFRNKVCRLNAEAKRLAEQGLTIKGNYSSVDEDGQQLSRVIMCHFVGHEVPS